MPVWFALFRVLREPLNFIPKDASLFPQLGDPSSVLFYTMDLQIPASEIATWIERIPYLVLILFVILTALYQQNQLTKKSGNSNNPQAHQMQMIGKIMPLTTVLVFVISPLIISLLLREICTEYS